METLSSECDTISPSPASVNRRIIGRSIKWMRQAGQASWGPRYNLRAWNPWTNKTAALSPTTCQQAPAAEVLDAVGMTTKAAGGVYEHLLSQEMQLRKEIDAGDKAIRELCSSTAGPAVLRRPNSNTNNKNPFSLNNKATAGLRDIQKHKFEGKQTTIITQFKAAESHVDEKVDINIIMDSESNMSNAAEDSSEDAATESDKDGGDADDTEVNTTDENDAVPSSAIEDDFDAAGEEAGDERDAEDSEPADDLPTPGEEKKSDKTDKKKLSMGHLDKEGIVIGCMNVFADVSRKEYIVLLTDNVVEAFLVDPGQFRSIAKRTGCEIEVTRRILNRRIGTYRWVKYLVVTLLGPNLVAIDQCDRLMVKIFPPYKIRKPYIEQAHMSLFVKETFPDNSDLYFNFQRTGPTCSKVGDLQLRPPFCKSANRPIESTPWKLTDPRLLKGVLEPRNLPMATSMQHVYPEWGAEECSFMDISNKWEQAGDIALEVEKRNQIERSLRVKQRKLGAEPLFAGGD